jgi:aerobic-type carbon monoxide dehydrogenase small subunit (CoxS/CutS family)
MSDAIRFTLNGRPVTLQTDGSRTLLWVLRTDLELTGTKYGCGIGMCGSCTVLLDGQAVPSCQTPLSAVQGKAVVTIEGLAPAGRLHPLQQAFHDHGGFQCGYCTPGMILGAHALLRAHPHPTREQIVQGLQGHLCRCGAHQRIITAVEEVAGRRGGGDD